MSLLLHLVEQEQDSEEYEEGWTFQERSVFDRIKEKLNPEAQEEIMSLEACLAQTPTEGDKNDGER